MKFLVKYTENNRNASIVFEAADLETCKNAVAQWQVNERRLMKRIITIRDITEIL